MFPYRICGCGLRGARTRTPALELRPGRSRSQQSDGGARPAGKSAGAGVSLVRFLLPLIAAAGWLDASAQHTLGFTVGYGMASGRINPQVESRVQWGRYSGGLSWRYYGTQRIVGGFGADLEFVQMGFSFAPNASQVEEKDDYLWYTRKINSIMLPIVWQPHFYLANNRLRVYLEAAATFSYNLSSTYENEQARNNGAEDWKGVYRFKTARDNRWGYGLAGGAGIAILIRRFELNFRARYYFGYADIVHYRTKYADNGMDGSENPFWSTPLRSPLDHISISVGLNYRFNREGFQTWRTRVKREKNREKFEYGL